MSNDTNNLEEILDPYAASEAIPAINAHMASLLQEVNDKVLAGIPASLDLVHSRTDMMSLIHRQRAALAEISKRYGVSDEL